MRARTLKGQIHLNEDLARLGDSAYKLFTGLLGLADRDGRLEDRPERIKAAVAPYHGRPGFPDWDCHQLLQILKEHGFIRRYEAGGLRCIQITSWKKHARPHKDEVSANLPEPPTLTEKPGNFTKSPETFGSIFDPLSSTSSSTTPANESPVSEGAGGDAGEKPKRPRARSEVFDAIVEVTGSDPVTAGRFIGSVSAAFAKATPPYTASDVRKLVEVLPIHQPWRKGRITVAAIRDHIGLVRQPLPDQAKAPSARDEVFRKARQERGIA